MTHADHAFDRTCEDCWRELALPPEPDEGPAWACEAARAQRVETAAVILACFAALVLLAIVAAWR